jgi:hydroxyacylglutathione hydrolase
MGCGRLFEGTPEQMWASLNKLRMLPGETQVYCGHEYTAANAHFAVTVDGTNQALRNRMRDVTLTRAQGKSTVPARLELERATNPFLRADDPRLRASLKMPNAKPVEVFAELRRRKDAFGK